MDSFSRGLTIFKEEERGSLRLSGRWKSDSTFEIGILEARDLAPLDRSWSSDPSVTVRLSSSAEPDRKFKKHVTKTVPEDLNPIFTEFFTWEISKSPEIDLSAYKIEIECWDKDEMKEDDLIGRCKLNIETLLTDSTSEEENHGWFPLSITPDEHSKQQAEGKRVYVSFENADNLELSDKLLRYFLRTGLTFLMCCCIYITLSVGIASSNNFQEGLNSDDTNAFLLVLNLAKFLVAMLASIFVLAFKCIMYTKLSRFERLSYSQESKAEFSIQAVVLGTSLFLYITYHLYYDPAACILVPGSLSAMIFVLYALETFLCVRNRRFWLSCSLPAAMNASAMLAGALIPNLTDGNPWEWFRLHIQLFCVTTFVYRFFHRSVRACCIIGAFVYFGHEKLISGHFHLSSSTAERLHANVMMFTVVAYASVVPQLSFLRSMKKRHIQSDDYPALQFLAKALVATLDFYRILGSEFMKHTSYAVCVLKNVFGDDNQDLRKRRSEEPKKGKSLALYVALIGSTLLLSFFSFFVVFFLQSEIKMDLTADIEWLSSYVADPMAATSICKDVDIPVTIRYPVCDLKMSVTPDPDDLAQELPISVLDLALLSKIAYTDNLIDFAPSDFKYKRYRPEKFSNDDEGDTGSILHYESDKFDTTIVAFRGTYTPHDVILDVNMMKSTFECHILLNYLPMNMVPWHNVLPDNIISQLCLILDPSGSSSVQGGPLGMFVSQLLGVSANLRDALEGRDAKEFLVDYLLSTSKSNLILTGHSLGGIVAQVVASSPELIKKRASVNVVTYNAPSVGWNSAFLKLNMNNLAGRVVSIRADGDAVSGLDMGPNVHTIRCQESVGECHSQEYMVCELWRSCPPQGKPIPCHCHEEQFSYPLEEERTSQARQGPFPLIMAFYAFTLFFVLLFNGIFKKLHFTGEKWSWKLPNDDDGNDDRGNNDNESAAKDKKKIE